MPDRILRSNILTSDSVNQLSWPAEVFYRRLMSVVDDYGRYEGRPSILRAALYPLQLEKVSASDVVKWMGECSEAGLVRRYTVDSKDYLEICKFQQRLRAMKSRYPPPPNSRGHLTADVDRPPPEEKRDGRESESESETEGEEKTPRDFLLGDKIFTDKIFMSWRITPEQLSRMLDEFDLLLVAEGKTHDVPGYKSHFRNWGVKHFTEYGNSQNGKTQMHY